jgi:tetratricopeptide (TPR) repeat protein
MNQRHNIPITLLLVMLLAASMPLAGCRGNPAIRKQRYLESGRRFSAEGKYREASIQFLNALKVDEEYPVAHYELAHAYEHMGQFVAASEELERTIDAEPGNLAAHLDLGNLLLANGRIAAAHEQANAVLAVQEGNPGAHALLSAIALRQGRTDIAVAEIKRAIELAPNRPAFHENLGILLARDPAANAAAEAEFRTAVQLEPTSLNARLLLASYFVRSNRLGEAERLAWDAVAADPRSLAARADVAQIILKEGDWARAEQVLRQASKDLENNSQGTAILADYYASTEQFDKARTEFSTQLARHPKNTVLQKGYVRVLIQTRDYATARTLVVGLLKSNPKDPEVTAFNGILLLVDGNVTEAANILRDSARFLPQDSFIQYWLGKAAQAKGEVNIAEISFRQSSDLDPLSRDPLEELARIASQRGDSALLEDLANRAIFGLPGIPDGYVWRAVVEMEHGSLNRAENDLNSAIRIDPHSWQAYLQFGKLLFLQKRFPEGAAMLEHALEYNPNSVQAIRLLADYDVIQKHPERALARVNASIQKNPNNSFFYDLLAQLQLKEKRINEAAETAQRAIQLNSSDGEAVSLFAQIAVERGMTSQAVEAWLKWSSSHPNDAGAFAILGTLEESRGNPKTAETYYKKSLQIQPRQPIAANNLAYRLLENDETPDIALTLAETARQAMPDSPNTADTLAWAYYHKGTYKFARNLLEDAIDISPDCASMHYHLGMVYTKLKDKRNAAAQFKKALTLPHDAQMAGQVRAALQNLG